MKLTKVDDSKLLFFEIIGWFGEQNEWNMINWPLWRRICVHYDLPGSTNQRGSQISVDYLIG